MINFQNTRLSTKIFAILLTASVTLIVIVTIATFTIVRELTMNSQKEKASLLIDTIKPTVSLALFLGIHEMGDKLSSITRLNEVVAIKIVDSRGANVLNYSKYRNVSSENSITITKSISEPSSLTPIGSITLTYSGEEFKNAMNRFYILYTWIILMALIIAIFLLAWINGLLKPIQIIAKTLRNFRPGERVSFELTNPQTEFKQIIQAFEVLQERVLEYSNEIQSINQNLELKVAEQTKAVTHTLYYDNLTGLPNRLKCQSDLQHAPYNTAAIINIDDFKEINDFFGIDVGDHLLVQFAFWLEEMKISPYRIGGDEFAFIKSANHSNETFIHDLEKLLSFLSEKSFLINDESVHIRATIGIALNSDTPLIHADVALNKAREKRIHSWIYDSSEGIEKQYENNIAMSSKIRQALIEHRIVCQYQPIVSALTGEIVKYETLVRIQNEDGTLIGPYEFLPIARKTKLYHHITQEVVYQACRCFAKRDEEFTINLSSSDILDVRTVMTIENILRQTGTAHRLIFEILESEGIENFEEVASFITKMKALGVRFAIDDFGTGYSNYENILKLNVDFLKIDGSLIRSIDSNPRHRIVVEAIVDFARRIRVDTVAEFVASEEILTIIKTLGITYAQGFHTGKPEFLPYKESASANAATH